MKNKMMILGIVLFVWLALVERVINAMFHISDYDLAWVVFYNGSTTIWLAVGSFLLYLDNQAAFNKTMMIFNGLLAVIWAIFFIWDVVDFIKTPDLGYLLFIIAPPLIVTYCMYWVIKCAITIKNTNSEVVAAV